MQFENVEFDAGFDSGNLREVQESLDGFPELADRFTNGGKSKPIHSKADKTFYLWTRNDGQTKNRTWFYFSMQVKSTERMNVELRFMNLNRVQNLFKMGMRPLLRHEQMPKWQRIPTQPLTQYTSLGMEMAFCLSFSPDGQIHPQMGTMRQPCPPGKYYLAYCLPYTYKQAQARIRFLEKLFALEHLSSQIPRLKTRRRIYFHRDILIHTLDGRNLDLLTVSSMEKIKTSREVDIEGLYPEGGSRSHEFDKPCFFISARVHPGETISSYMMDGFVDFIISDDPRAIQLRDHFVFKIVPMVNPDGVYRGHYRGDNNGVNLNRVYDNPNKEQYPTIWAIVQLIQTLNLEWYIDLHGHANKPGTFLFGNWIPDLTKQHQMMTFARAMHLNSHVFDMTECDFAPKQMVQQSEDGTKEGTGRVSVYRKTGCTHCYTYEANYYGTKQDKRHSNEKGALTTDKRFTHQETILMGKHLGQSVFDCIWPTHPLSSLSQDPSQQWIVDHLRQMYQKHRMQVSEAQLLSLLKPKM